MRPQAKSLRGSIEKWHEQRFSRKEIIRRAMKEGYPRATVLPMVSRVLNEKGDRQRARRSDVGKRRSAPSAEAQKILKDVEARYGERTAQLLQEAGRHAVRRELPLTLGEIEDDPRYPEGAKERVLVNAYERNRKARAACIEHYGANCCVYGMKFDEKYGNELDDITPFFQVHHLVPLASVAKAYNVNPIRDLLPVCPNCHAVIHMRKPPFTPEEVREML